jgi:hypothetical protein
MFNLQEHFNSCLNNMLSLDIREGTSDFELLKIQELLLMIIEPNSICIEIGSWKGSSSYAIASIVKLYENSILYCVDHWEGNLNTHAREEAKEDKIWDIFINNINILDISKVIRPIRMSSHDAISNFKDESIDFIFIDGDHTYDFFRKDIELYWPKLKIGGIMCGHDCSVYYSKVDNNLKKIIDNNINVNFVNRMHCGIVRGLYDKFNDDYTIHDVARNGIWSKIKEV